MQTQAPPTSTPTPSVHPFVSVVGRLQVWYHHDTNGQPDSTGANIAGACRGPCSLCFFLCPLLYAILFYCLTEMTDCDDEHSSRDHVDLDSREYDTIDNSQIGLPHVEGNTPTRADLEGGDYSDPRYHGEVNQERGSSTDCTNPQSTATTDKNGYTHADVYGSAAAAPHINTPTRADLEADGYSDPHYHGDVNQERGSLPECTDPQTDDSVYTQPDLCGSGSATHISTPTRTDLESEGYSDPRYYGEVDVNKDSLSDDCTRPDLCVSNAAAYVNTPTRADLEAEGYSDPRYYGEVDVNKGSLSDDSTRPDLCGSNAATQHSKSRHINTPTRADLETEGYSDPRYYGD